MRDNIYRGSERDVGGSALHVEVLPYAGPLLTSRSRLAMRTGWLCHPLRRRQPIRWAATTPLCIPNPAKEQQYV